MQSFSKDVGIRLKGASDFVSSSDFEGMSNSMLEAMAIGLPTICTDCPSGGAREIIQHHENGILVPIKNIDALCSAMTEVADNPELMENTDWDGRDYRWKIEQQAIFYADALVEQLKKKVS